MRFFYPNRTLCDVLDEMRKCDSIKNYAPMAALIEEVQIIGNRMEAALANNKDYESMLEDLHDLKKEIKELYKKKKELINEQEV